MSNGIGIDLGGNKVAGAVNRLPAIPGRAAGLIGADRLASEMTEKQDV